MLPDTLDYATATAASRRFARSLIICRILSTVAMLTWGCLEIINALAGFALPLEPPPPQGRNAWRAMNGAEDFLQAALLFTAPWLYPLMIALLIMLPQLASAAPARKYRLEAWIRLALVAIACCFMFYRGYLSALLRAID